jgi:general stress protein 26
MDSPAVTVDPRFSFPATKATDWAQTVQSIENADIFWITTVRADGRPHVVPLVAVWFGAAAYFCTGAGEQKALNLSHNHHVVLTTGVNQWRDGLDIVIEGEAARVTDAEQLAILAQLWSTKWDGRWQYQVGHECFHHPDDDGDPPHVVQVFSVRPHKIFAFAKGNFGQTRYQF